jgi:NAD(P)-dependent dehydrogenase (short-subunit alcohol dehydrogenase family)
MDARRFEGRTALVTGAGTGIGRVIAGAYAREGAAVVVAGRRRELLEKTAVEIRANGGECLVVAADVTRETDCARLVRETLSRFGRLDVLVNNAGAPGTDMPVSQMTLDNWNATIAVNLTGPMLLAREALRQAMIPAKSGNIQFVSSQAAKRVLARKAHYAAAKMGLIPLAQTLALEVSAYDVRVNTIVVGLVRGELVDRWVARSAAETGKPEDEIRAGLVSGIPLRRAVEPEEVAAVSLFLASDAASAITGQNVNVTNGGEMR